MTQNLTNTKTKNIADLPQNYQKDISRALKILKAANCNEIFLFGSLAAGTNHHNSDIDLAIRGCPSGQFFTLFGQLLLTLDHSVDLVHLDKQDALARYLEQEGNLVRIV